MCTHIQHIFHTAEASELKNDSEIAVELHPAKADKLQTLQNEGRVKLVLGDDLSATIFCGFSPQNS